jgi:exonuclease III
MFNLLTLNINGLNDHIKRTALIDWLKCMKADIVYLQETHASSHSSIQGWFRNSGFYVASSFVSNKRCGTAILVWNIFSITQVKRDDDGRFLQVKVDIGGEKLRFVSLYAPNRNPARNAFFASVPDFVDLACPTFVCGDFNSVLDPDLDRKRRSSYKGPSQQSASSESVAALQSLLVATQTFPVWRTRHPTDVVYAWDHPSGDCSSRIDMIWAPTILAQSIGDCAYHPSFFSDHRYMLLTFTTGDIFARGPGVWKFNVSLLEVQSFLSSLSGRFGRRRMIPRFFPPPLDWWDQGKFYLREVNRCFARARVAEQSCQKFRLNKRLKQLQRLFDGGDSSAFTELCAIQEELRGIHLREARASQVHSRCRWAEEGETSSAFFLSLEKKHRAKQSITSIRDPDSGLIHHNPFEILGTWQHYYTRLFTADKCDMVAQDAILSNLSRSLSRAEVESCEGLLSIPECKQALDGMSKGKTPGSDGFPMEFFSSFWDVLGADLVRILNYAFDCGKLSTSQRRGLIIVLYKKDDHLETKNYRPISLLNVDYKIATRAISGRLLGVIGSILGSDQTCAIPGRTISENLCLIRDLIEYADLRCINAWLQFRKERGNRKNL